MRRLGVLRTEGPRLAVRPGQPAVDRMGFLPRQRERVGQRAVTQPGDVAQPVGVGEVDPERSGDVEPVGPVLGQAGRGQRGRLERARHPRQPACRARRRGAPTGTPAVAARQRCEHHRRLGPLLAHHAVGRVVHPGGIGRPASLGRGAGAGRDRLVGLGEVQHDVGDAPARRAGRGSPRVVVQCGEDPVEPFLLRGQVIEDVHGLHDARPRRGGCPAG